MSRSSCRAKILLDGWSCRYPHVAGNCQIIVVALPRPHAEDRGQAAPPWPQHPLAAMLAAGAKALLQESAKQPCLWQ